MDQLIGALAEPAASAARGGAEPEGASAAAQQIPQKPAPAPAKAPEKASEQAADVRPAAHTRAPHVRHEEHAPHLAQAFHRRSSLLAALVAFETLGPPPALRPRELRGDLW